MIYLICFLLSFKWGHDATFVLILEGIELFGTSPLVTSVYYVVVSDALTPPTLLFLFQGGCIDSANQSLALVYMTLGQQDVSKALLGHLSPYTQVIYISFLQ